MIIGFAAKKGSGKDLIAQHLVEKYNFKRYAFGDPVKDVCKILFGFSDEQLFGDKKEIRDNTLGIRPRDAFQKIDTEFGRKYIHNLFPLLEMKHGELWIEIFKRNYNKNQNIVISDVRFPNEAKAIRELGGVIIYIDSKYSKEDTHESEFLNFDYDYRIMNYGTKDEFYENFDKLVSDNPVNS